MLKIEFWAKNRKKEYSQKSASLFFCHPGHSQKTGFLGPKLEDELGKARLFQTRFKTKTVNLPESRA